MSLKHVHLKDVMSPVAITVDAKAPLADAQELMTRHGIRHLPVLDGETLAGVLSDRDLHAALSFKGASVSNTHAGQVCARDIYVTHPGSDLRMVAAEMAEKRYGSAVVTEADKVVGIFTTTDACRVLGQLLSPGFDTH